MSTDVSVDNDKYQKLQMIKVIKSGNCQKEQESTMINVKKKTREDNEMDRPCQGSLDLPI